MSTGTKINVRIGTRCRVERVMRDPGDVVTLREDTARSLIGAGYGVEVPVGRTKARPDQPASAPVARVAQRADTSLVHIWMVIPTKGRWPELRQTLERVAEAKRRSAGPFTLVIADDSPNSGASGDAPTPWQGLAARFTELDLRGFIVVTNGRGPNAAINAGVRNASADAVVVVLGDHDWPAPDAFVRIRELFSDPAIAYVYGHREVRGRMDKVCRTEEPRPYKAGMFREVGNQATGITAFRMSVWTEVGGIRETEFPAGDYGFALRVEAITGGKGIVCVPEVMSSIKIDADSISIGRCSEQAISANRLRAKALAGVLVPPTEPGVSDVFPDFSKVWEDQLYHKPIEKPLVSIVTLVKDEWALLNKCLVCLARNTTLPFEVIVIENAGTGFAARKAAKVMETLDIAGRAIRLSANIGFSAGNNWGARHAQGEYVCFLNPDTEPPPGWLKPMVDFLADHPDTWMTGNLQAYLDGRLQSIGSEYNYRTRCFDHVRRGGPIDLSVPEIGQPTERDMVTGACFVMPRARWCEFNGFDERYQMLYWEDTDLCMRVREAGGRIFYVPTPPMPHVCGGSCGAPNGMVHYKANSIRYHKQWVETGVVEKLKARRGLRLRPGIIRAGYIVLNEEEYLKASVDSIAEFVDEIHISVGGTKQAHKVGQCGPNGEPTDGTLAVVDALAEQYGDKLTVHGPALYNEKDEQRELYTAGLTDDDWLFIVDGDEVWYENELWRLAYLMHEHEAIRPGYWSFWNNFFTIGTGVWDAYNPVRLFKWRSHYSYIGAGHEPVNGPMRGEHPKVFDLTPRRMFAHYSWVKPVEKLRQKYEFYRQFGSKARGPDYMDRIFLAWRTNKSVALDGTHVVRPEGGASPFEGAHPPQVAELIAASVIGGDGW